MAATGFLNRVYVNTATTGTGTITLGAAVSGNMITALEAGGVDGQTYSYVIEEGTDMELGYGVLGGTGTTLTRATVTVSKIGGTVGTTKMNLAGSARVRLIAAADDFIAGLSYQPGHLRGLTLSNDGTDPTNDVGIAVGTARDGDDTANMDLASALIKKLDAAWAVGTNQGMLDGTESSAGTPDTSTWYHIWLIKRPDTGVVDVLASESATAPTMPTNYTLKRRIGAVYRTSGAAIRAFVQDGDRFAWQTPVSDVAAANPGTAAVTRTLSVPVGIRVRAQLAVGAAGAALTDQPGAIYISDLSLANAAALLTGAFSFDYYGGVTATSAQTGGQVQCMTNTSAQIRSRLQISAAGTVLYIATMGWVDTRDRY